MEPSVSRIHGQSTPPVVYAGRFAEEVRGAELPNGCRVLNEWELFPLELTAATEGASVLVILDPFSFPFEAVTEEGWDVPLVAVPPVGFDVDFLDAVFGEPLFRRVGFFDRVAIREGVPWEELSRRYRWAEGQRLLIQDAGPGETAAEILARLDAEPAFPEPSGGGSDGYDAYRYWGERGDALARRSPGLAIRGERSGRPGPGFDKAMHRVQATALVEQFAAARGNRDEDVPFGVLEVGVGVGRWVSSFDPAWTEFSGVDVSEGMVEAARANHPGARFDRLGSDLLFPYEDEVFDLVFTVDVLHHNPIEAKQPLLSEMWRVARPGGRLLFLEDFVAPERSAGSTVYPMSMRGFMELLIEATAGRVTLEHVESLRYPGDDAVRAGLVSISKLGVPKKW